MAVSSVSPGRGHRSPIRRPRLHYVYFALAAFDLVTVCLSLFLFHQISRLYVESVQVNQEWAERLADFSELSRLAAAVNAPGNDVFASGDPQIERSRLEDALATYREHAAVVQARIDLLEAPSRAEVGGLLDKTSATMTEMAEESRQIFRAIERGDNAEAGAHMAVMDRHYNAINVTLSDLNSRVREMQQTHFVQQVQRAALIERFEYLIAGLIVIMIAGVTFYGHRLARQARNEAVLREQLIEERTRELEESHQQLRMAERLASIGTLAAGLGHDMSNVLFPVRCRLDLLAESAADAEVQENVRSMQKSIEFLQKLSDGLRLLSMEAGDDGPAARRSDLKAWWNDVEPLMRTALRRDVELTVSFEEDLRPAAVAPHRLTQAVFNMVVNAVDAIEGAGRVQITAHRDSFHDRAGRCVAIAISDTGSGMSEEVRRRALEPFFSTKTRSLSTGLGLALVHGVVRQSQGEMSIDSAEGAGTTITMRLPEAHVDAEPAPARGEHAPRATVALDDARLAGFVRSYLEMKGFIVTALDGATADSLDAGAVHVCDAVHLKAGPLRSDTLVVCLDDDAAADARGGEPRLRRGGDGAGSAAVRYVDPAKASDLRRALDAAAATVRKRRNA